MFVIDLTLAQKIKGRQFHGGGEYGLFAALFILNKCHHRVIVFVKNQIPDLLQPFSDNDSVEFIVIDQETSFSLPDHLDRETTILFLPLPYIYLKENKLPNNARCWIVIHGLRDIEISRLRIQGLPIVQAETQTSKLKNIYRCLRSWLGEKKKLERHRKRLLEFLPTVQKLSSKDKVLTVSDHTEYSLRLYCDMKRSTSFSFVRATPLSVFVDESLTPLQIGDSTIKRGILLLSAERREKNISRFFSMVSEWPAIQELLSYEGIYVTGSDDYMETLPDTLCGSIEIHKLGYCSRTKLTEVLENIKVLAYPSLNEGFGIPPVDALRCGAIVVASPITSISEVLGDSALYANPFDTGEMAVRLLQALTDQDLQVSLRKRGHDRFKELQQKSLSSWNDLIEEADGYMRATSPVRD